MKRFILIITLMVFAAFAQQTTVPKIMFDTATGGKTVITGIPAVLNKVNIGVKGYSALSYTISNDTVVISVTPVNIGPIDPIDPIDPIPLGASIRPPIYIEEITIPVRFTTAGVYKFFMIENFDVIPLSAAANGGIGLIRKKSLGNVRILPLIKIDGAYAFKGDSISFQVILGEKIDCADRYITGYTLRDSSLLLTYRISPTMPVCIPPVNPVAYGPSYKIPPQTKNLSVYIEDTTKLGLIVINEVKIIEGNVSDVTNSRTLIENASIIAFKENGCSDALWAGVEEVIDTAKTSTDKSGSYSIKVPNDGSDYRIEVLPISGSYRGQAAYSSIFPITRSIPPRSTIDFALIPATTPDTSSVIVKVTKQGQPFAGATLNMTAGREQTYCAFYETNSLPIKPLPAYITDANGNCKFNALPLVPFTWYAWGCYASNPSIIKTGKLLVSPLKNDTLFIELDPTAVEVKTLMSTSLQMTVTPKPFNTIAQINFSNAVANADVSIMNVMGQKVFSRENFKGSKLSWNARNAAPGTYIIKAKIGRTVLITKTVLTR
ncbi:MAG: T9SS type A sorting domain-containing protein [Fibrobacteres bacterium]|nr:T9SS type A sorting domain-containing protein [Fibrobacterota bacterium]